MEPTRFGAKRLDKCRSLPHDVTDKYPPRLRLCYPVEEPPMRSAKQVLPCVLVLLGSAWCQARADEPATYTRTRDVIYGRKFGMALTMDVFAPKEKANGVGVIAVVSGGWFSKPENINPAAYDDCLNRGYTV